uniref:Uncharacterized protein n=1 Tax=Panagrolaimus sp. JU765 TaxID=591449 RepID=A0AC34QVJ7_9BILA
MSDEMDTEPMDMCRETPVRSRSQSFESAEAVFGAVNNRTVTQNASSAVNGNADDIDMAEDSSESSDSPYILPPPPAPPTNSLASDSDGYLGTEEVQIATETIQPVTQEVQVATAEAQPDVQEAKPMKQQIMECIPNISSYPGCQPQAPTNFNQYNPYSNPYYVAPQPQYPSAFQPLPYNYQPTNYAPQVGYPYPNIGYGTMQNGIYGAPYVGMNTNPVGYQGYPPQQQPQQQQQQPVRPRRRHRRRRAQNRQDQQDQTNNNETEGQSKTKEGRPGPY